MIPNDGECWHDGETMAPGFVESTVKSGRGQMLLHTAANAMDDTGSPPAVQMRVNTLNQELGAMCQRWYPDLQLAAGPQAA